MPAVNPPVPAVPATAGAVRAGDSRYIVDLVGTNSRLTVVYSDSDDGVGPERLIATSDFSSRYWWKLGGAYDPFSPTTGQAPDPECDVKLARLSPHVPPVESTE